MDPTCSVQTPLGPRKSGIPQEVDMPAPVNATRCLLCNDRKRQFRKLYKIHLQVCFIRCMKTQ